MPASRAGTRARTASGSASSRPSSGPTTATRRAVAAAARVRTERDRWRAADVVVMGGAWAAATRPAGRIGPLWTTRTPVDGAAGRRPFLLGAGPALTDR